MGRACIFIATALAALAALPAEAQARDCHPRGARTVARTPHARVFAYPEGRHDESPLYGCLFRRRRAIELADGSAALWAPVAALLGPYVGVGLNIEEGAENPFTDIEIMDLRNGQLVMNTKESSDDGIGSVVINRHRAAAWIGCFGGRVRNDSITRCLHHHDSTQTVYARPSALGRGTGEFDATILDQVGGIDPFSLRLQGSRLTWKDAGVTRHTTLR
jgi:hypothetical protein